MSCWYDQRMGKPTVRPVEEHGIVLGENAVIPRGCSAARPNTV